MANSKLEYPTNNNVDWSIFTNDNSHELENFHDEPNEIDRNVSSVNSTGKLDTSTQESLAQSLHSLIASEGLKFPYLRQGCGLIAREYFNFLAKTEKGLPIELPSEDNLPPKYKDRGIESKLGRKLNPIEFYQRYWKPYAEAGLLYQHQLREWDEGLIKSIHSFCQRKSLSAVNVLPPTRSQFIAAQISSLDISERDIIRFASWLSRHHSALDRSPS